MFIAPDGFKFGPVHRRDAELSAREAASKLAGCDRRDNELGALAPPHGSTRCSAIVIVERHMVRQEKTQRFARSHFDRERELIRYGTGLGPQLNLPGSMPVDPAAPPRRHFERRGHMQQAPGALEFGEYAQPVRT